MQVLLSILIIFAPTLIFFCWFSWEYYKRGLRLAVVHCWHLQELESDTWKVNVTVGELIFLVVLHSLPVVNYIFLIVDIFYIVFSKIKFLNKPL